MVGDGSEDIYREREREREREMIYGHMGMVSEKILDIWDCKPGPIVIWPRDGKCRTINREKSSSRCIGYK